MAHPDQASIELPGRDPELTDEERAAMKQRTQELKAEARRGPRADKADPEGDVLAKIAELAEPDRAMAERLHALITASASPLAENLVRDARLCSACD
jgi:hypothetical protein